MSNNQNTNNGLGYGFNDLPLVERMQAHVHAFHEMKMKGQKSMCVDMMRLDDVMKWFIATKELYLKSHNQQNNV